MHSSLTSLSSFIDPLATSHTAKFLSQGLDQDIMPGNTKLNVIVAHGIVKYEICSWQDPKCATQKSDDKQQDSGYITIIGTNIIHEVRIWES